MRLLLDQGLPRSAAAILRGKGWDVIHVGEIGMAAAADEEILAYSDE
jgi:predicted nuclease of predicted toxin-antitoxin system